MSFADLKRNSKTNFEKLNKKLSDLNKASSFDDDRKNEWRLERDKAGNGSAVIRFLPAPDGEDFEFVRIWDHGFQGPGGWYIEKSLTTIGQADPIGELNSKLWTSGIEADKEQARKQKRRLKFWSNVYIIKDPANPDNEGKVFKFAYGKKIFDKINDLMNPQFEDEEAVNPFDLWTGANFRLKIRQVDGWPSYDKSEFETPGPLFEDESKLEEVYTSLHSLTELVDPKGFKTYAELKTRLNRVLGITSDTEQPSQNATAPKQHKETAAKIVEEATWSTDTDDEDDDLDFFKRIASED